VLAIVKLSVECTPILCVNTLHQGESIFRAGGPTIAPVFLIPLALMGAGYTFAFVALWLERPGRSLAPPSGGPGGPGGGR